MFHSNTEQLIDYWHGRRGAAPVAARSSINPTDFAHLLPQVFMLGRAGAGQYHFRLAGGFIADLHGRDLRGEDFARIWRSADRDSLQLAIESARRGAYPLVIEAGASGDSRGSARTSVALEIMLSPLAGPSGDVDRMMGFYQPTSPVAHLQGQTVQSLTVTAIRGPDPDQDYLTPRLRLVTVDGRRVI